MDSRDENVQRSCDEVDEDRSADPYEIVRDGFSSMVGYKEGIHQQLADLENVAIKILDTFKLDVVQKIGQVRSQFDDFCDAERANMLAMAGEYKEKKAKLHDASAMLDKLANLTVSLNSALRASPAVLKVEQSCEAERRHS